MQPRADIHSNGADCASWGAKVGPGATSGGGGGVKVIHGQRWMTVDEGADPWLNVGRMLVDLKHSWLKFS